MGMIEFGDHGEEERKRLLEYLAAERPRRRPRFRDAIAFAISVALLAFLVLGAVGLLLALLRHM